MINKQILMDIESKYQEMGENPEIYLKGLLHSKPINYWDYIEAETLLSLQKPRTNFKDEEIFIMYHQITELVLKMMEHEIRQLIEETFNESIWIDKLDRLIRYTELLINSFGVMQYGMNYDDYNTFRYSLTPASGYQSVTFRRIELYCTGLINLLSEYGKENLLKNHSTFDSFNNIYWKDAGYNRHTGKKSQTLIQFENKYLDQLISLALKVKGSTLEDIIKTQSTYSDILKNKLRKFDYLYNVAWPLVHLETAQHYLDSKDKNTPATGGSEWKKYLHPSSQHRILFPILWDEIEKLNWGLFKFDNDI